jgi:hypothetical protein
MNRAIQPLPLYAITARTGANLLLLLPLWLGQIRYIYIYIYFFLYGIMYMTMCPTGVWRTAYRFLCLLDFKPN